MHASSQARVFTPRAIGCIAAAYTLYSPAPHGVAVLGAVVQRGVVADGALVVFVVAVDHLLAVHARRVVAAALAAGVILLAAAPDLGAVL